MAFELTGKLHKKFDTEQVSDRFQKREFVLIFDDNGYEQFIKFQLIQDKCVLLDNVEEGAQLKVYFNLKGREYTNRDGKTMYFTNLDAWKLENINAPAADNENDASPEDVPEPPDSVYNQAPPEQEDDLPF